MTDSSSAHVERQTRRLPFLDRGAELAALSRSQSINRRIPIPPESPNSLIPTLTYARVCVYSCLTLAHFAGAAQGFDEYMNLVLDDASEVDMKQKSRKSLGRVMLKGDNITAIFNVPQ